MSVSDSAQRIADVLAPAPPSTRCGWRWGTVTANNGNGTAQVQVGGSVLTGVRLARHVSGVAVGDRVRVAYFGTDAVIDAARAVSNYPLLMRDLGTNPVKTTATDTWDTWAALGSGLSYYNTAGQLNGQPSRYSILFNMTNGYDVAQLWKEQRDGGLYIRGGNSSQGFAGWHAIPYVTVFYSANNKATITLPADKRYLLVSTHNSTLTLNGIAVIMPATIYKVAGMGAITFTRSGNTITATTTGGNPLYSLISLE